MLDALPPLVATLLDPWVAPGSRTFWPGLLIAAALAAVVAAWRGRSDPRRALRRAVRVALPLRLLLTRSSALDLQLLLGRQLLAFLGLLPVVAGSWWLAFSTVRALDGWLGAPAPWSGSLLLPSLAFAVTLFITWDLSRYIAHRLMHEVPALWAFHQVHHSAEVLTPLTFHRVHPVESLIYGLRGALVTGVVTGVFFWAFRGAASDVTLLGVNAAGLLLNAVTGNLRHSHVWLRFPAAVERWLISPAQHQLHHADDPALYGKNYGTWLAVWDRLGGSLVPAPQRAPERFGVSDRNHADNLVSAWFGPFLALGRRWLPIAATTAAVAFALSARAAPGDPQGDVGEGAGESGAPGDVASAGAAVDPAGAAVDPASPAADPRSPLEILVVAEQGVPRVVGSAHIVDAEELRRYQRLDIHEALNAVPGVYVRTEDGFGLRPNIGLRGANSDRSSKITLLEDGVLLGPAPYAAPAAYYFPMTIRATGLEVFKGPAATQHGPHTVGGAINVQTRAVPREGPAAALNVGAGERGTSRLHGWAGTGNARAGALIEGALLTSRGFRELDTGGPTGFTRGDLMFKGRLATDPERRVRHAVELKLGYGAELANETYLGLTTADFQANPNRRYAASALDQMAWSRTQAELSWTVRAGEAVHIRTVAYHHFLDRTWTRLNRFAGGPDLHGLLAGPGTGQAAVYLDILRGREDAVTEDQLLMLTDNARRFHSGGVQSVGRWHARFGKVGSTLELGLRVHADRVRREHIERAHRMTDAALIAEDRPGIVTTDTISRASALAAHVHQTLEIGRFTLVPGARVELVDTSVLELGKEREGDPLRPVGLPGVGGMARIAPHTYVFAGIHRGFSPVAPGSPAEIRPESSWNTELGLRAGHAWGPRVELVGFVNDYSNLTGQCTFSGGCTGDDIDRQFNGGRALVGGIEAVVGHRAELPRDLSLLLDATFTWTEARFQTGFVSGFPQFGAVQPGFALPYVPRALGSVSATVEHDRFSVSARGVGRSAMADVASPVPFEGPTVIPTLLTAELAARARLHRAVAVWATASNVTNRQPIAAWRPFGARPVAPRQILAGVELLAGGAQGG